jgi:hypothetical protein
MPAVTAAQRDGVVTFLKWWIANNQHSVYAEYRPVEFYTQAEFEKRNEEDEETEFDCSSSADEGCFAEGTLGDPSGPAYNFNGFGNTQTQYEFLPHLPTVADGLGADLIMFDPPPEDLAHVCVILEPDPHGGNPIVFNNGGGPVVESSFFDERENHPGQAVTVLSIANLSKVTPPPTPKPDPEHYAWFDNARIWLPQGINKGTTGVTSEGNVVRNADVDLKHPAVNKAKLELILVNLKYCHTRVLNNEKSTHDPQGKIDHRKFRATELENRIKLVEKAVA